MLRRTRALVLATGAACWLASTGAAQAVPILIGAPPQSIELDSFIPFGGLTPALIDDINDAITNGTTLPTPRFQQVYDAASFGELAMFINSIKFFQSEEQVANAAALGGNTCDDGDPPCGTVTVRIGKTNLPVNGLDPDEADFDDNFDPNGSSAVFVQDVLVADLSSGGMLQFTGTPFLYNPDHGNLLIDVQFGDYETVADLTQNKNDLTYLATGDNADPVFSLVDNYNGLDNLGVGLVTEFDVTFIPEPATGLLTALGLAGLAAARRQRAQRG